MESNEIWMTVLQLETYGNCVVRNSKSEPYSSLLTPLPMLNFFFGFCIHKPDVEKVRIIN